MSTAPAQLPSLAGPPRPRFLENASDEQLWNVIVALSTELAATRGRLDALERVLAEHRCIPPGAIEAWKPSTQAGIERTRELQDYTRRVFETLAQD